MAEISNPNQQGGGDNRSLVAMMVVMVAVFFGLQMYRAKTNPRTASPSSPAVAQTTAPAPGNTTAPQVAASGSAPAPVETGAAAAAATPAVQAAGEQKTTIENELYKITFTNHGADVVSWILKGQTDTNGKPLDLVHQQAADRFGKPLSLYTYEPATTAALNEAMYVVSAEPAGSAGGQIAAGSTLTTPATLTFHYAANGLEATKTFRFDQTYVLHADVAVTKNGTPVRALLSWPGGFGDQDNAGAYNGSQLDLDRNGSDEHLAPKKVSGGGTLNGPFDWAGVSDSYFAAVFLPDQPATATLATFHNELEVKKVSGGRGGQYASLTAAEPGTKGDLKVPVLGAALGDVSGHTSTKIFVGPKAISVLKGIHAADAKVSLEPLLEFGFWGIIGKYLFLSLQFIHSHIASNWGWAIIILTVLINILMLPFKIQTMKSALKMQRIQPQIDVIKEKYKKYKVTDPKRNEMNAEIMELQKREGVNMFGGCIPTLITLPLLYAFFTMLPRVVELRHAHWFWLPDLQSPDPLHILPILMVASMFLMQYYTPSPGVDAQQQKMMAFMMPAISGYFTWNYGSGLALYWAVGNLIGITQQLIMNRTSLGKEMREIAAKRARRKAGTPQVIQGRR